MELMEELSIDQLIERLEVRKKYITEDQDSKLAALLRTKATFTGDDTMNGLLIEIQEQMTYLKNFRKNITAKGDQASTREIKDMIQASISLFSMLTKMNDDITNQDRLRKVENATVEVVRGLSVDDQKVFFNNLEEALTR